MNAPDLLAEFASQHGLGSMQFSDAGTAQFSLNDVPVGLEHDAATRSLHLYVSLGEPPPEGREACFARLLEANLFGRETNGASVGFDRDRSELLLTRTLDLDVADHRSLEMAVEGLVAARETLQAALAEESIPEAAPGDSGPNPFLPNPLFRA